ncbi:hypothetical protein AB0L85_22250 [Streptomyces sp. NPDC052051]|uniref:hypothetical protein n=1 Tax=Streptomyces sp. NPDC052051 TaxID=3154649 RepID=UPI0034391ED3
MIQNLEDAVVRAIARCDGDVEELEELADRTPEALTPYLPRLLAADVVYPAKLYRAADSETQRGLVAKADAGGIGGLRLNHLLMALAQTRGPVVEAAFRRWRDQPPLDADKLCIGPAEYMREGGWMLEGDRVRELCGPVSYELRAEEDEAVRGGVGVDPTGRLCQGCGGPMWTALDLDSADERVAEALAHVGWSGRLRVAICYECNVHRDTEFIEVGTDGTCRLSDPPEPGAIVSGPEVEDDDELPAVRWRLGRRTGLHPSGSALGGRPVWTGDATYPECPVCGTLMTYIAQVDMENISYVPMYFTFFLHTECGLAAMVSQGE